VPTTSLLYILTNALCGSWQQRSTPGHDITWTPSLVSVCSYIIDQSVLVYTVFTLGGLAVQFQLQESCSL